MNEEENILAEIASLEAHRQSLDDSGWLDEDEAEEIDAAIVTLRRKLREMQTPELL